MSPEELPGVGLVVRAGADDRVYDACMVLGPLLVLGVVAFGRTPAMEILVATYFVGFLGYVVYNGRRLSDERTKTRE